MAESRYLVVTLINNGKDLKETPFNIYIYLGTFTRIKTLYSLL